MDTVPVQPITLLAALRPLLGEHGIIDDPAELALAGSDLLSGVEACVPDLLIRPKDTDAAAACLAVLAQHGSTVTPRGAGLSYTGGVVPRVPSVVVDTAAMTSIRIEAEDLTAIVGAGCTWQALAAALAPHGLRPAVAAPISGSHSTVGGAASQGVAGSEGIIGLAIVLADGSVIRTGSWSAPGGKPFSRHYGPDLTGLFIGDCGAFGVKTEIALRLLPPAIKRFASFGFERAEDVVTTMTRLQQGPGGTALAFDRARAESATAAMTIGEAARTVAAVSARAGSLGQAIKSVIGLKRARTDLQDAPWSLHLTAEGCSAAHAEAQLDAMRQLCRQAGGAEIPPAVPQSLEARPFSVRGLVGPDGERWVPVHGHLPLSAAAACVRAIEQLFAERAATLDEHRIRVNWLLSACGPAITMEPMFYWRDALDPLHLSFMSDRNRQRFAGFPANPAARAYIRDLRLAVRDVMDSHGATHHQLGRFYRPPRGDLLAHLKRLLDPQGRMNPGVLGL